MLLTQAWSTMARVTRAKAGRRRTGGTVDVLPSGALRVRVYAGKDPVCGRRHDLVEIVPAGPKAAPQADAVRTCLFNQVDERRHPQTSATVDQLLDRHFEMATLAPTTLAPYVGYATKHIQPLIGQLQVGALYADLFDSFYAELRRCRDHCDRRPRQDHRTTAEHECDARCRPHRCAPMSASMIRQVHFILSGALKRAVRWRWIGTSPIHKAEPPAAPKPDPRPPTADQAARLLNAAWEDPDWATLVWLAMVTGARRGELCALRRPDLDLSGAVLNVRRSIWQRSKTTGEKDTKDGQGPPVLALQPGQQSAHVRAGTSSRLRTQEPASDQLLNRAQLRHPPSKIHHPVIITADLASEPRDTPRLPLQY